jgi:hypothetical protein
LLFRRWTTEVLWQFQVHLARSGNFVHRPYVAAPQKSAMRPAARQECALFVVANRSHVVERREREELSHHSP